MKRSPLKAMSATKRLIDSIFQRIKFLMRPKRCARCGLRSEAWRDLDPHHPYGRDSEWAYWCFLPLCRKCHDWVHSNPNQAREDGWLIKPKQTTPYELEKEIRPPSQEEES